MYMSEESKIAPTIVVLFSFPGFRFTDKVLHYLIFGASYTKKEASISFFTKKVLHLYLLPNIWCFIHKRGANISFFTKKVLHLYLRSNIWCFIHTKKSNASYFKSANSKADPCHII